MFKKILITLITMTMLSSLSIYATEVSDSVTPTDPIQSEDKEETPKDEDTLVDKKNNNDTNTNKNDENNTNTNTNTSSNKGTGNKTNTSSKGQSKPKKDSDTTSVVKSKEAKLKELKLDVEGMTPEFSPNITEYYLTVNLSVEQVKVTAVPVNEKAKVTVTDNQNLKEGKNTITITVKAEDSTIKKYYIYVTKIDDIEKANAELKSLEITHYDLSPKFKTNIYNYNLNIGDDIQSLEIKAEAEKEKAKIEIEGNDNLQEGENIIKIKVTAEDGETVRTYKINAYISSGKVEVKEESKLAGVILMIIVGCGIIGLSSFLIWKKKH